MNSSEKRKLQRPPGFVYRSVNRQFTLYADDTSFVSLAKRFGTPLYVYSASTIRTRLQEYQRAFRGHPHTICYSVKANSNLSILRLLAAKECGFDVVSGGELERVQRADPKAAKRVVFSGVGKTHAEMRQALDADILLFNLESQSEMRVLAKAALKAKKIARIAFRVNPDVPAKTHPYISTGLHSHKFGVPIHEARRLYAEAARTKYLQVAGISVHIGSQITDVSAFSAAMERVARLAHELADDGHRIDYIDAGGGLGISYEGEQQQSGLQMQAYARALLRPLRALNTHLLLEPGRSIIGAAGLLLTRVLYKKQNGNKRFVITDAGMNDLIRPALYGAKHQIAPVVLSTARKSKVEVVGPVCESGDFFAHDCNLQDVNEGDLLAVLDAGAYGMSLASNYNSRPRPAEVLVSGKRVKLIRHRETIEELVAAEL